MPRVPLDMVASIRGANRRDFVQALTNNVLAGLSFLYGDSTGPVDAAPTTIQEVVMKRLLRQVELFVDTLQEVSPVPPVAGALDRLAKNSDQSARFPPLDANRVDGLPECGLVDPQPFLRSSDRDATNDPRLMFPHGLQGVPQKASFRAGNVDEYIRLTVSHLRSKKVGLMTKALAAATVFCVPKSGNRLREVYNGTAISGVSRAPPLPPLLASPTAMGHVEVAVGESVWLSKLDGEAFFDQLKLPPPLVPYMGRPAVRVRDLITVGGMSLPEVQDRILDGSSLTVDSSVVPVNLTWSMGISWSSLVAQSTMVHAVLNSGYTAGSFLTEEHSLPDNPRDAVAVATDDIGILVVGDHQSGPALSAARARRVAASMAAMGIREKTQKRLEGVSEGTLLGIQLVHGHRLQVPAPKMVDLVLGLADLCERSVVSPADLHSLQASCQWYCLLRRCLLSCFDGVYNFVRQEPRDQAAAVPIPVLDELILAFALAPLWSVDLRTPWLERLVASDASDAFGFGVCSAPCPVEVARQAAGQSARQEAHVRLIQEPGDDPEKPRLGKAYRIPLPMSHFKVLASRKAKYRDHSGGLEATALELAMDLLSRDRHAHGSRVTFLVDARAVLFAAEKGRSTAPTLRRPLRRIAALTLACGWIAHFAYVPSESNPADAPSRGLRLRRERARQLRRTDRQTNGPCSQRTRLQQLVHKEHLKRQQLSQGPYGRWLGLL